MPSGVCADFAFRSRPAAQYVNAGNRCMRTRTRPQRTVTCSGQWFSTRKQRGRQMRFHTRHLVLFALLLFPASALAQATLSGTVQDSSGSVIPGVTVEATSPALIEKVRT